MRHFPIKTQDRTPLVYDSLGVDYISLPADPHALPKNDGMRTYLTILRRRKWYILVPIFLIMPLTIVALYLSEPTYQATARVLIENSDAKILPIDAVMTPERSENFYLTEYQLLRSEENIGEVVDLLGLDEKQPEEKQDLMAQIQAFKSSLMRQVKASIVALIPALGQEAPAALSTADAAERRRLAAISAFASSLQITPREGGKLVDIVVSGPVAAEVAQHANTLAEVYTRRNLEKKREATNNAMEWLTKQTDDLQAKMYEAELQLQKFREKEQIVSIGADERNNIVLENLKHLHEEYNKTKALRVDAENRLNHLTSISEGDLTDLQSIPPYLDPHIITALMRLRSQYQQLELERANNIKTYRPKHPIMVRIDSKIEQTQRDINDELRKAISSVRNEYAVHLAKENRLATDLDEQKQASLGFSSSMITYDALRRDAESYRNLYQEVSERLREIKLNQVSAINNVAIVKRATVPLQPVAAKKMMTLLGSMALAGCLGVGCAFIREYLDNRFKEADEVESLLQIPFLGMVPHYVQGKGRAYEPVSLRDPGSLAAEAYRILRTRLQATVPALKSLLVTSALPSEGKSTTTANLGIAFARLGLRVLLVDVDLRRPSLHRHFWVSNAEGLATVLVDGGGWEHLIQDTPVETLKILPTGFNMHNPSDLLSLQSTKKLFDEFKQHFDLVIFDAPIVLSIPDVEIIAPWMDGVILVHFPERCDKPSVLSAKGLLDRVGATIIGAVFNNISRQDQRYYHQQRTYYSQNLYGGTEQYDLGLSAVRRLDAGVTEAGRNGYGVMDELSHPTNSDEEMVDLVVSLDKVIVNDSIADAHADATRTFLILELSLKNVAAQTNAVAFFRPEAAVVRLDRGQDSDGQQVVSLDTLTEKIRNGLPGEVAVRAQEEKKGMVVYRIPRGMDRCVFEYGRQRVDITLGF